MASALARRSSTKKARVAAPRRARAIARAGGALAKRAASAAAGAARRAKESGKTKAIMYGTGGAIAGAIAEVKVPQIPDVAGLPKQLLIGGVLIGAGFALKGKVAEALLYGGQGPFFAGVSSLTKRLASGGTLAGQFDGESYGQSNALAGEFDDIAR